MLSLLYRIGGDVNPLRQALKQGERAAAQSGTAMGKLMGSQIKAGIMRYIGAGALLGGLTNLAREAQRITRDAAAQDMSTTELQILEEAAERAGISIERLVEAARESPEAFAALRQSILDSGAVMDEASTRSLNSLAERAIATRGVIAQVAAFIVDATEGLFYTGVGLAGRVAENIRGMMNDYSESPLTTLSNVGIEGIVQRRNPELFDSGTVSPATELRRVADANAHWESIGGNIDWSAQSREVESRQTRERTQELLRMQVEQQRQTVSALHDLRNEMRNL